MRSQFFRIQNAHPEPPLITAPGRIVALNSHTVGTLMKTTRNFFSPYPTPLYVGR